MKSIRFLKVIFILGLITNNLACDTKENIELQFSICEPNEKTFFAKVPAQAEEEALTRIARKNKASALVKNKFISYFIPKNKNTLANEHVILRVKAAQGSETTKYESTVKVRFTGKLLNFFNPSLNPKIARLKKFPTVRCEWDSYNASRPSYSCELNSKFKLSSDMIPSDEDYWSAEQKSFVQDFNVSWSLLEQKGSFPRSKYKFMLEGRYSLALEKIQVLAPSNPGEENNILALSTRVPFRKSEVQEAISSIHAWLKTNHVEICKSHDEKSVQITKILASDNGND